MHHSLDKIARALARTTKTQPLCTEIMLSSIQPVATPVVAMGLVLVSTPSTACIESGEQFDAIISVNMQQQQLQVMLCWGIRVAHVYALM